MSTWLRHTIWFNRAVLGLATLLFTSIAVRGLTDPVGSSAAHGITFGSAAGITVARVGFGGFPLSFALVFLACLLSERRLLTGLAALSVTAVVVTSARLLGLAIDGPAEFTLRVLKPEVVLVVASTAAVFLERRRRQLEATPPSPVVPRAAVRES